MARNVSQTSEQVRADALLHAVAEQLKQPLLYIRQSVELDQLQKQSLNHHDMYVSVNAGLSLIEHYITWQRYKRGEQDLTVQQMSLSAVMRGVHDTLQNFSRSQQTALELKIKGRYEPILAESKLLESGLHALGLAFIEAAPKQKVVLGVHKTRWGIAAGVYSPDVSMQAAQFKAHKQLLGNARQLFPAASYTPMSGVAMADALFSQMFLRLHPSRHDGMDGLAVTLAPSPQLSLL
jgi:signal transduction histidine kinase